MLPTTTPFPVTMDYSQWYWDPSTYTWLPSAPPTSPCYSDPMYSYDTSTPTTSPITTGFDLNPYSYMNQDSYDGYVDYCSANYIPGYTTSNTSVSSYPMPSPAPAPPVALAPCSPPAPTTPIVATSYKCGNCGTTESCKWRNVTSKDNIRCNTCFGYRQRNKKERPAAAIQEANRVKMMKAQ